MRGVALALVMIGVAGCSEGAYDVVLRFEPPSLGDAAERAQVAFVESCDAQTLGAPAVAREVIEIRRMGEPEPLGEYEPGTYGLYARAFGNDCAVVAAGCATVELEKGGEGELVVVLRAIAGAGCPAGSACVEGACMTGDAAGVDAGIDSSVPGDAGGTPIDGGEGDAGIDAGGIDAGMDAGTDAGVDAGAGCGSCDDGEPCTRDTCVAGACVNAPDDTLTCGGGVCHAGSCCRGCWDGSTCQSGGAVTACGVAGVMCATCDDGNPCTDDVCTLSGCLNTPNDARTCPGGTCHGGACCTGCWDGTACRPGTAATACGTAGGACTACACPTNACSAGSCAPADTAASIGAGHFHTCAAGASGRLYCWGENDIGQLGIGTVGLGTEELSPVRVGAASDWSEVKGGEDYTCGLRSPGALWCWGDNQHGVLMQGDFTDRQLPTRVGSATNWSEVVAGEDHACMLKPVNELWCGGENDYGQIGVGDTTDRTMATQVPGTWSAFGLGYYHTCAIQPPGTLWCWGRNNDGQLGLGVADIDAHPTPIQVGTDTDWAAVTGGENITCALKTDGSLWCWGGNDDGQLGLGTIDMVQHPNPSRVGTATWAAIAVGEDHVCGIRPDSSLWCWGENTWGQVGDGTSGGNVLTPTRVGSSSDWTEIDLGEDHTCGVRTGGSTWCWGLNTVGQLGDGSRTTSTAPGRVCFPLP